MLCLAAVGETGLDTLIELFHRFARMPVQPESRACGITDVVLLAESHLAVHTWPEIGAVTLDVYACHLGQVNSAKAEALKAALRTDFSTARGRLQREGRGLLPSQ